MDPLLAVILTAGVLLAIAVLAAPRPPSPPAVPTEPDMEPVYNDAALLARLIQMREDQRGSSGGTIRVPPSRRTFKRNSKQPRRNGRN